MPIHSGIKLSEMKECISSIREDMDKEGYCKIIIDGKLEKSQQEFLNQLKENKDFRVVERLKHNSLGDVLKNNIINEKTPYIFRMDGDDIVIKGRFREQINYLENSELLACNSDIIEFDDDNIDKTVRKGKLLKNSIDKFLILFWNPLNHVTMCFKKEFFNIVHYEDVPNEDWHLWKKAFLINNIHIGYIPKSLVRVRFGKNHLYRRVGFQGIKNEIVYLKAIFNSKVLIFYKLFFTFSVILRCFVKILPFAILKQIYNILPWKQSIKKV